ncbi:MAG: hypothetical protein P8J87_03385 [Verrucomicrobiales bacterium]|nr:hypothetical protein [Verrucomicrobiales bacterium]
MSRWARGAVSREWSATDQSWAVLSWLLVARTVAPGLKASWETRPACWRGGDVVIASGVTVVRRAVLSLDPEAMMVPLCVSDRAMTSELWIFEV